MRLILMLAVVLAAVDTAAAQEPTQERGVSTSMFGTYIGRRELLLYPFYEYYGDKNFEYKPADFGVAGHRDLRGRFHASEGLLFIAYGFTSNLAVEFEIATIRATLQKSAADTSALPARVRESGLGDVEGQVRWRWNQETARRPEWFSYSEYVIPHNRHKPLIGTAGWEFQFGTGVTRAFTWGTLTARGAIQYEASSSSKIDFGEYAVEIVKDASRRWRLYAGVEGTQDEVSLITEAQWRVLPHMVIKLNNGVGLTSKAVDWSPEVGILFTSRR